MSIPTLTLLRIVQIEYQYINNKLNNKMAILTNSINFRGRNYKFSVISRIQKQKIWNGIHS